MRRDSAMASATGVGARPERQFNSDLAEPLVFFADDGKGGNVSSRFIFVETNDR